METLVDLLGPLHPPMTHFPIVCSILAVTALGWGMVQKKEVWLFKAAGALWIIAFLSAVPSVLLGHLFAHNLGMYPQWSLLPPDNVLKGQLRFHAILGTLGLGLSLLTLRGALCSLRSKPFSPKLQLSLGLAVAVLFGLAGHEGGEMTYGEEKEPASTAPVLATGDLLSLVKDYRQSLVKMNSTPWNSRTHGHRWVNTYVSKRSAETYKNSGIMPEGSLVVKESFEDQGGKPSDIPGPLYLMRKGKTADSPQTGGWEYAMTWDKPVTGNPENIQGPVTWRTGDSHLNSCMKCHSHFKSGDYLGGVPDEVLAP